MNSLFDRRKFIKFFGGGIALASSSLAFTHSMNEKASEILLALIKKYSWKPLKLSIPHITFGLQPKEQLESYAFYEIEDDLILPEGFTYNVIASWGDPVGDSRYGFNNDHIGLVETDKDEAYLVINHECVDFDNFKTYLETFPNVMKYELPDEVLENIKDGYISDFSAIDNSNPDKDKIKQIVMEAAEDMGISVISIKKKKNGDWIRTYSDKDRRISIAGAINDPKKRSKTTGPARSIFIKKNKQGFEDGLGDKCLGSYWNCSGTTTPWGTVLSAEEYYASHTPEPVRSDGTSFPPNSVPFVPSMGNGFGNILGLAGNKYGWAVEVDPNDKKDFGTKHTMLGRYFHEAFAVNSKEDMPIAVYSGCDRKGGHIYKFISEESTSDPKSKSNSKLLEAGILYAAKFNSDGTGKWIPLSSSTNINPVLPSEVIGSIVSMPHPDRTLGGVKTYEDNKTLENDYVDLGSTLGDLYSGENEEQIQGAILIDAHFAANAIGATSCPRPEDCEFDNVSGELYFAFTAIDVSSSDSPNKEIFGNSGDLDPYQPGQIVKIRDTNASPSALNFTWETLLMGGEPSDDKSGWANPDNLEIDGKGNLWMITDVGSDKLNQTVENRNNISNSDLRGIYGNNSAWLIPRSGEFIGLSIPFAIGPSESELCGLEFSGDHKTLFLTPQHPGLFNGTRINMAYEEREFLIKTTDGKEFKQIRRVPIGSNWPSKKVNDPPKPSLVGVRRNNNQSII